MRDDVRTAAVATQVVFAASGALVASWASRIPSIAAGLALSPSALGLALLTQAVGGLTVAPLSGTLVAHVGTRRATAAAGVILGVGLAIVAAGSGGSVTVVVLGLFVLGAGIGLGDVTMSVHGTAVEAAIGRPLLARAYGWFGIGGLGGAAGGAAAIALLIPPAVHLGAAAGVAGVVLMLASRGCLDAGRAEFPRRRKHAGLRRGSTRELMTLGLVAGAFAFAENAGSDWIGVALARDRAQPVAVAAVGYGCFIGAITAGRFALPAAFRRLGPTTVLRTSALLALSGVALFAAAPSAPAAIAAVVLWGAGCALGVPTALQLAGANADRPAARVAAVTTSMYVGFLIAPPAIGLLGNVASPTAAVLLAIPLLGGAALIVPRSQRSALPLRRIPRRTPKTEERTA